MPTDKRATIGPHTTVNFPKLGIKDVHAKVDTGADASSIWASNVREKKNELSFTLFAPGSPHYTGEIIKTKNYKIRSIKNSFGVSELRYKVKLNAIIEKTPITVSFSLADRSDNQYPILIGRRTLHGRFVVDVSHNKNRKIPRILVMDVKGSSSIDKFLQKMQEEHKKIELVHTKFDDLTFEINNGTTSVHIKNSKEDVADFDFVYFKSLVDAPHVAPALAHYLQKRGIPFIDRWIGDYALLNKLTQYVALNDADIRVPHSLRMDWQAPGAYQKAARTLGKPFIFKDTKESKGRNNFLIKSRKDFAKALAVDEDAHYIAQQYIPNDGDYRILIFGKRIELVIRRMNKTGKTHLNNTSMGGEAALLAEEVLPGRVRKAAVKAAELAELEVAGVDMIQDKKTGLWYCLEIQHGPQLTSGAFVKEKRQALAKYFARKLSGV